MRCIVDSISQRPRTFQIVISFFPYKHIPTVLPVHRLVLSFDSEDNYVNFID